MNPFHGDLLIGGAALRGLDGELDERGSWCGRFLVEASYRTLLEERRSYLLMLDDGRAKKVVETRMCQAEGPESWIIEFRAHRSSRSR